MAPSLAADAFSRIQLDQNVTKVEFSFLDQETRHGNGGASMSARMRVDFTEDDLSHARQRHLYAYWQEARCEAWCPPVASIDPMKLPRDTLSFLSVLEVVGPDAEGAPQRFRVRLHGTEIVEATGIEITGRYLDEIDGMARQIERCRWMVRHARPYLVADALTWSPRLHSAYTALNLPFGDPDGKVRRIVAVFAFT